MLKISQKLEKVRQTIGGERPAGGAARPGEHGPPRPGLGGRPAHGAAEALLQDVPGEGRDREAEAGRPMFVRTPSQKRFSNFSVFEVFKLSVS